MEPIILDGKAYADEICNKLADDVREHSTTNRSKKNPPTLIIVTTGRNQAGMAYLRNKINRCIQIGIDVTHKHYNDLTSDAVDMLCCDHCPIIFQLPIVSSDLRVDGIIRKKLQYPVSDVDGFVAYENVAKLYGRHANPINVPCTPAGIIRLLRHHKIEMDGKVACVIGRSDIVGRPVARLLDHENATVIQCNSHTPSETLLKIIDMSDIIISAVGQANFITTYDLTSINRGMRMDLSAKTIVDVGINCDSNGKLCGDIQESVKQRAYAYTPVPGGIGPMTVAMLMENVVNVWKRTNGYN